MRFLEARSILDEECIKADGKPASTNKAPSKSQNEAAADEGWWLKNCGSVPPYDSPRTQAYLRAYMRIAGERPIFAKGIPLEDGYMWPDRGVMKALLMADCVTLIARPSPRFEVTVHGWNLLQSSVRQ